jgi:stress response protein YsnF
VPLEQARVEGNDVVVPYAKDKVKDAPRIGDSDGHLEEHQEAELYRYYGLQYGDTGVDTGRTDISGEGTVGHDTSGPTTDTAMTRSEERLTVDTVTEPWTRAVLRIETVTEEVMVPVTITRQQARIEYLPLRATDGSLTGGRADGGLDDGGLGAPGSRRARASEWVTLYGDQPVVTLERVPVERVRLTTEWVTEEQVVTDRLRHEEIELTEQPRA